MQVGEFCDVALGGGAEHLDQCGRHIGGFVALERSGHRGGHLVQAGNPRHQPTQIGVAGNGVAAIRSAQAASSTKVDRNRSGPLRSKASSDVTCCQPSPISPNTMSSGTNASSRMTSLKWCAPFIEMIGRISMPGPRKSTMNWLRPAWRCCGSTGAVRASAMNACGKMRPRRPDLRAGERPAAVDALGAGAHAGQVGAGVRLAHPDAEEALSAHDPR